MTYWKFFKANLLKLFGFLAALCIMAFIMYRGDDHAAARWVYLVCGFVAVVSAFALFVQWNKRIKGHTDDHPNGHRPDVCEGCDPIQYADGRPLSFEDWKRIVEHDPNEAALEYAAYLTQF